MKKQTKAFTLVELIVVIVILAILGTIAFISFQGYSRNSRDGVRIADINSAKKSLEIFITKAGFYPTPDNGTNITYSGAIVWTEGTLGSNVTKNIQSLNKVITDPLTSTEYTYSITSSKTEYQIGGISEGGGLTSNQTINNTYATDLSKSSAVAYISGNYNEKFTKVNSGTISWILAEPSIISTDKTTSTDLANILANKKLAYNNYPNIPSSFSTPGTETGGFNYSNPNPIIYSGTLEDLHDDNTKKLAFITNLKQAYASTDLATNPTYQDIMNLDTSGDQTGTINLAITYINSNKGGIKLQELALLPTSGTGTTGGGSTYNCATQPTYTHATFTAGTPTQTNQAWQNTNSGNPCYYTCTDGYSGSDCTTTPPVGWRLKDSNCKIDDIVLGTQTWAGCNSTLGNGFERGKKDDGTNGSVTNCYNYDGQSNSSDCIIGSTNMLSTSSAKLFFDAMQPDGTNRYGDSEFDTIWGKLYTRSNAESACPTGRHVPSLSEFATLENYIAGTDCRTGDGWQCEGLGWRTNSSYNPDRKLVEALKIPLSGYRDSAGLSSGDRGSSAYLYESTLNGSSAYFLRVCAEYSSTYRRPDNPGYGFSVRCIKD